MKKITILALHLGYGGVEKAISSISNILVNRYEVEIISVYKLYDEPAFYIDDKVKITYLLDKCLSPNKEELKLAIKSKNLLKILKEGFKSIKILNLKKSNMIKAIKNINSGIVISTRIEHNELLSKFGKKSLIKIAQEHTYHKNDEKFIHNLVKSCENIDYLMPVSKELTEFYKKYFKGKKTKCEFIPHSLDFIPKEKSSLEERSIISIGRLSPEKGFDDLIDVFNIVSNQKTDWKLNIIGDGSDRKNIEERIKKYKLEDRVILHGYQNKDYIDNQFMKSSIYAMGSHEESFGLVLIEAQSFGIPCIAFNSARGACEIIEDYQSGYLINNRNKKDMAEKIIKLIDDIELRKSMGVKSSKNALTYSTENVSKRWFDFLDMIICNIAGGK